jgi:hypothetical protein
MNPLRCFVWVSELFSKITGRAQTESAWKQDAGGDIWL